jgi:hypothetical protein
MLYNVVSNGRPCTVSAPHAGSLRCAAQSLKNEDAENIGYVIPPPVIHHFLDDFGRNGRYTGFPSLGIEWQKMESPYLQKAMGMKVRSWPLSLQGGE